MRPNHRRPASPAPAATLLALLAFGALPGPSAAQTAAAAPPAGAVSVPRVEYRSRVLPNGLTVYSTENHRTPTVAIQVWYKVGAKNDPNGRSGFAHLFEHMMFKSTRNMRSEMLDRLTEDVGGENNAYTADDVTVYHETVPSNYLETLLWAEADRMANLNVDAVNFASERKVVQEEYRERVLASPYGRLGVLVDALSFTAHPYKRSAIGSIADLEAATVADVQAFHRAFYRPDNAVLVVVGDFDPARLDAWVDRYFGRIAKPEGAAPRVTVTEPARTGEKRYTPTAPGVPLPALEMTFLAPPAKADDAAALRVADMLLSGGESSRLYRALVYEQQVASEASSSADLRGDAGLFHASAVAAGGKTLDQVEKSLLEQIDRIKDAPVSAAELDKARSLLLTSALRGRETNDGIASALGDAAVILGDPERVNTDVARLAAVTAADVQRAARKYLTPENRVVIRYDKGPDVLAGGGKPSPTVEGATVLPPVPPSGPAAGPRENPPSPAAPRAATLPAPVEKRLGNGLRVVVVPQPGSGLVTGQLAVKTGGAADPDDRAGLAEFTAALLTKGTATRTATQIAEEVEALGGFISSGASWDSSSVSLSAMRPKFGAGLAVLSDVVRNPAFKPDEVERLRQQSLDDLEVTLQSPGALAGFAAARVLFGAGKYGHPLGGTPESLKRLRREEAARFHAAHFRPANAVLVLGGDVTPEEGFALAEKSFGDWKPAPTAALPAPRPAPSALARPGRVVVIDKPDAGQAAVLLVRPGIRRADPEYYRGVVANAVFGNGYSSRLNQEVRIRRGLSYGAGSSLSARRDAGPFTASAQTRNEAAPQVASLLKDQLARLASSPLPATELTPRKAAISGDYARGLETGGGLTGAVTALAVQDVPLAALSAYLPQVQNVTAAEVKRFAAKRLPARDASLVIVGDGRKFLPALRQRFKNVEVIPAARLDLNRPDLRKP